MQSYDASTPWQQRDGSKNNLMQRWGGDPHLQGCAGEKEEGCGTGKVVKELR